MGPSLGRLKIFMDHELQSGSTYIEVGGSHGVNMRAAREDNAILICLDKLEVNTIRMEGVIPELNPTEQVNKKPSRPVTEVVERKNLPKSRVHLVESGVGRVLKEGRGSERTPTETEEEEEGGAASDGLERVGETGQRRRDGPVVRQNSGDGQRRRDLRRRRRRKEQRRRWRKIQRSSGVEVREGEGGAFRYLRTLDYDDDDANGEWPEAAETTRSKSFVVTPAPRDATNKNAAGRRGPAARRSADVEKSDW
ncbi:hypothetical protein Syun_021436 [Stephania yunnanensis]|uniref:Uncharacterized protein n=1 Tax=Stephania yunnanensis TaxID=152371 RepID=A0AAP0NQN8_9MAGN